MLRIGSTVLGVASIPRAMDFWSAALDYVPRDEPEETWVVLQGDAGRQLSLMKSDTPAEEFPRVHLDLYAVDAAAEIERLLSLGAKRVDWPYYEPDSDFVVLADPDGNRFCVIEKT